MSISDDFSEEELDAAERRLRKLAKNPNHIPGIYNYCDRWCERCPMTSRCLLFAQENAEKKDAAASDARNGDFWRAFAKNLAVTGRMIRRDAKRLGIDLSAIDPKVEREIDRRKARRKRAKTHDVPQAAMGYIDAVNAWFEAHRADFGEKGRDLSAAIEADIPGRNPMAEFNAIEDAADIIRWYQHQIYVKLARALSHDEDGEDWDEDPDDPDDCEFAEHDANGSAKVALIGIDRSIAAWARLREHFADEQDAILDILVTLDRLRNRVETLLPEARQFKRPGFDE